MTALLVKNGYVYDPLNGVNGEKKDIFVKDGKIVEEVNERDAKVIDAKDKIVMPGGVDLHSHIAGSKINIGRLLRPEDHRKDVVKRGKVTRGGVGYSCPSTFVTGYRYAEMGYTGDTDLFDGEYGFWKYIGFERREEESLSDLGVEWYSDKIDYKRYPCGH